MAPPLLALQNVSLSFGGAPLLTEASLSVSPGERVALVGRNGSGKSTLLKIAAGIIDFDDGTRFVQPGVTVKYLPQEPDLEGFATTLDYVTKGLGPGQDPYCAPYFLEQLGLTGNENPRELSGGEKRRAALARVLAPEPDVLLLDEPTNHLDLPAIEWLESQLKTTKSALVLISHDRTFLKALSRKTLWLDAGQTRELMRGFEHFEKWRDSVLEEEELARHKLGRKVVAEEHWLRYGVTARRKRNVRRLKQLNQMRAHHSEQRNPRSEININVAAGKQSGMIVIDAKSVSKTIGSRTLVRDFSLRVLRGDRVAIVGPNGAGKTTLINLLIGNLAPDAGEVRLGTNIELALLDQTRSALAPQTSLKDALTGGGKDTVLINGVQKHVIAYMKDFLFTPEQLMTPLIALSGGERARVMLARALALPSNVLVLDEPTNDLDLETLDLLQETIAEYAGTVLAVSHDRDFINRVATITIIAEGEGRWTSYAGGYADMLALRGAGVCAHLKEGETGKIKKLPASQQHQPVPKKQKLSFKEKHALETLPARMVELEARIGHLETRLSEAGFFQKNPDAFTLAGDELARARAEHEKIENQWLELEILREEIEGN